MAPDMEKNGAWLEIKKNRTYDHKLREKNMAPASF